MSPVDSHDVLPSLNFKPSSWQALCEPPADALSEA
jgi:hypothetical protein